MRLHVLSPAIFLMAIFVPLYGSLAQGILEYETCFTAAPDRLSLERVIFACSKITGDSSLPTDIRAKAFSQRAQAYVAKFTPDNIERAISDHTEAIRLEPKRSLYYLRRGEAYSHKEGLKTGKCSELAAADYTESIRLEPKAAQALYLRGSCFLSLGKLRLALSDIDSAISFGGSSFNHYHLRGAILEELGRIEDAVTDYRTALKHSPCPNCDVERSLHEGLRDHLRKLGRVP